jgi:predicted phosphodiesterase
VRIGVVSDIHANVAALDAALELFDREDVTEVVMLGDVLSYGCRPLEVIERLRALASRRKTTFLVGNHDQLYFELQAGESAYFAKMPSWIQESARWTVEALRDVLLVDCFPWVHEYVVGDVLFTHANPFGRGDWTYLNAADVRRDAARALGARGLRTGVFGHTHRSFDEAHDGVRILSPGSVGQPRDKAGVSTLGILDDDRWRVCEVAYDVERHVDDVMRSSLSEQTRREIVKFHSGGRT